MKFFIFLCLLSLASGQNCLNDCRVVCDPGTSPSSYGPPRASLPGKQGPKGDRGDRGLPGRDGLDNGELLSANQKKISKLERIVYKVLSEEIAKECGLGVQDREVVSDDQLRDGSHWHDAESCMAIHGRLFGSSGATAWIGSYDSKLRTSGVVYDDNWIEVDFLSNVDVSAVATQGREVTTWGRQHVTSYQVQYKEDGHSNYKTVQGEDGRPKVFKGNTDNVSVVINSFNRTIQARVFRIQVVSWNDHPAMRFDFINC